VIFQSLANVYRGEGIRGLWRGLGANLIGVTPSRAVYFSVYNSVKHHLGARTGGETPLVHLGSAAMAGVVTATATNPIWVVKVRMQLQQDAAAAASSSSASKNEGATAAKNAATTATSSAGGVGATTARTPTTAAVTAEPVRYRNSVHALRTIMQEEGVRGLYRGVTASYLGVAETSFQFMFYESLKTAIRNYRRERCQEAVVQPHEYFAASALSKLVASVATYPHEVVRTRLRERGTLPYRGAFHCFYVIGKTEGMAGLYGGMGAHLTRTVPNAAFMFLFYELIVRWMGYSTND
jgi:solute carrier family 25, member 33/36